MKEMERVGTRTGEQLAFALGWFGIGLGLAEMAAPKTVARLIGVDGNGGSRTDAVLRGFGVREIASGLGILRSRQPSAWLWSRVAGDVMDLAFLGSRFGERRGTAGRLSTATAAVAAVTVLDVLASRRAAKTAASAAPAQATRTAAITVNRSPQDVYGYWRRLENLPRFMPHLQSVVETGPQTSHWVVTALGTTVEWDAEITEDVPGERIAWRAVENADVPNEGHVTFGAAPGGHGTEVRVSMSYEPPAGKIGAVFAKILGTDPGQRLRGDLRRLKQLLETGEIPTTEGQPSGRRSMVGKTLELVEHGSQS
jgi:uncharacterized membrane protein